MFLYHLNHSFANQSIFSHADEGLQVGDCMTDESKDNYYLVLWQTIHRDHLYKIGQAPAQLTSLLVKGGGRRPEDLLLSSPTIQLIHHLTHEYYTTYVNIIKLFLPSDIEKLIKKSLPASSLTKGERPEGSTLGVDPKGGGFKQNLIIMPDRRTIINKQSEYNYTIDQAFGSQHTSLQDIKLFWNIKAWLTSQLVCTPGECFRDYRDLAQITLIDPHKRYYKSQQEPRYDIMRVCELMAHYYWATLTIN